MANATVDQAYEPIGSGGRNYNMPVNGGSTIYRGTMQAQLTATGMLVPATTAASGRVIGVSCHGIDNSAGSDGDKRCMVHSGRSFALTNATAGDACSEAMYLGQPVYATDDTTVADNSAGDTRPLAGFFDGMEPDGRVRVFIPHWEVDASANIIKRSVTITSADLTTAGTGPETENIGAVLPNTAMVIGYRAKLDDAFDNGSGVSLAMEIGHSNDVDAYEDGFDCFTSSALEGAGWAYTTTGPGIGAPAWDGTAVGQLVATFTAGADQLANFTNGSVTVEVFAIDVAAD